MSDTEFTAEEQVALQPEAREPAPPEPQVQEQPPEAAEPAEEERAKAFVPIGELQKERNRRRDEAKRREDAEQQLARAAGRLDVLEQAWKQPPRQEQAPQLGSVDEAPIDHIKAQGEKLAKFEVWQREQQEQAQQQTSYNNFANAIRSDEAAFVGQNADYYEAIDWLRASRDGELEDAGYPPAERERIIRGEIEGISGNVLNRKGSPAEAFYKMAKRRGYQKAQPANGAEQVERIERGQAAGRSLSQAGGASPAGKLSLEKLVQMDDDDFAAIATDPKKWRAVMGG